MIAAVTGATGIVGRFTVERLLAEGVAVRAWRRPTSDLSGLPGGIAWIEGSLGSAKATEALLDGADMLVHCAFDHVPGLYRGGEGDDLPRFLRVNVGETLALLASARDVGIRRCVALSSRAVFGSARLGTVGDDARVCPDTAYGGAKAALEAFVESCRGQGWALAALRPTGVYGSTSPPERSKWFDLVGACLRGEPFRARSGSEVHGRDMADAVWRLLTADASRVAGRIFNCSDIVVSSRDIGEIVQVLSGAAGPLPERPPPPVTVMACPGLAALGLQFGGWPLLRQTIGELVSVERRSSAPA